MNREEWKRAHRASRQMFLPISLIHDPMARPVTVRALEKHGGFYAICSGINDPISFCSAGALERHLHNHALRCSETNLILMLAIKCKRVPRRQDMSEAEIDDNVKAAAQLLREGLASIRAMRLHVAEKRARMN